MYAAVSSSSTIAASLLVLLYFVLEMALKRRRGTPVAKGTWVQCPCCKVWMKMLTTKERAEIADLWQNSNCYCGNCWRWWIEWQWEMTRDCMLMLATRSLQDNPNDVPY